MQPPHPDASDNAHLREMYERYLQNTTVATWLLLRDAPVNFHAVRKEQSVLVSISAASPPDIVPQNAPHAPFPHSHDLMFVDRVEQGFALGHVWGDINSDQHPYAPLATRAGKTGWHNVRSRKFASDITVDDALESVEFAWFSNHRAIVVLTRIPFSSCEPKVRLTEILFYAPIHRTDILTERPELIILMHDSAVCVTCSNHICTCPNVIGVNRGSLADVGAEPSQCRKDASCALLSSPIKMSWEHRMRMIAHGKKSGLLTIVYTMPAENFPRITVSQVYHSSCANQDEIACRIQQHCAKYLLRLPHPVQPSHDKTVPTNASSLVPSLLPSTADNCDMTSAQALSGQSPISLTSSPPMLPQHPKDDVWYKQSKPPPLQSASIPHPCNDANDSSCCPKPAPIFDIKNHSAFVQSPKKQEQSVAGPVPASAPGLSSSSLTFVQSAPARSSVCGPEKADGTCDCSAEDMPDPSLALILNSSRDRATNLAADVDAFVNPVIDQMMISSTTGCALPIQPVQSVSSLGRASSSVLPRDDERTALANAPSRLLFGSQSSESVSDCVGSALQSSLPPPSTLPEEPPLKRHCSDDISKSGATNLSVEPVWPVALDEREKSAQLVSWNRHTTVEGPLPALSRALGVTRSPSSLALIGNPQNSSSPSALKLSTSRAKIGKMISQEHEFQNQGAPNISMGECDLMEPVAKVMDGPQAAEETVKREFAPNGAFSHTNEGVASSSEVSGASGVCCEICGISFAKRSNKLRHIQTVHNRVKQFECDLCGAKFGLKADLGRHRYRIHESRAFCCITCGKSFTEQEQLNLHVRVTHEEDSRPWECKKCRIRFGRKSSLTRHEQTVHQQTRFECKVCKKSYSQKFDAIRHERKVHGFNDKANG